jgi:hypothetical protein
MRTKYQPTIQPTASHTWQFSNKPPPSLITIQPYPPIEKLLILRTFLLWTPPSKQLSFHFHLYNQHGNMTSTVYYSTVYQPTLQISNNTAILWETIISTHLPISKLSRSSSPPYSQHFNDIITKNKRSIRRNFQLVSKNSTNNCTNSYYNHPCLKPSTN